MTAAAVALCAAAPAHAAATYGPAMAAGQIRAMQSQGVRELIVKRDPGMSAAEQSTLRAQAGISFLRPGPLPDTELDRAPAGGLATAVAALRQDPQVQYAEPNGEMHATSIPDDRYFGQQWGLENTGQFVWNAAGTAGDDIGATYAWQHSTGSGVTVAVVDTGADSTAPDLTSQLLSGVSFLNGVQGTDTSDQNGHGTHVSGIIAAEQNNGVGVSGVAPDATVLPLRVLEADGSGTVADVAAAFAYAGQHGIRIVNASLGGSSTSQTLVNAIESNSNTLYVVAAGNGDVNGDGYDVGYDVDSTPFYPCDIPAANVICVGASDQNDRPASFSNYGASNVDVFAPGVNILSTYPGGYKYADGTSMAAPMVSGTLALMLARNPSLNADELKGDLLASADRTHELAGLSASGGELDAAAAVAAAGGGSPYAAPGNLEAPQVSGPATVGATLSADPGSWSRVPTAYAYQWQRCVLGACVPVAGATSASYTLGNADYGATFDVVVSAGNAVGSSQATSAPTAAVGLPPGAPPPPSAGTTPVPAVRTLRLTRVALVRGRGTGRGPALVFTLSARARVQISLARTASARGTAADVLHRALVARRGQNRYPLSSLLGSRRLPRGTYTLAVHAGKRTVTLRLRV